MTTIMFIDSKLHLYLRAAVLILMTGSCADLMGQAYRYVQPVSPILNATSWHGSFAVSPHYVSIRNGVGSGVTPHVFTATSVIEHTIVGRHTVRFESREGLFRFFEEEPKDHYQIITDGVKRQYQHNPDAADWREALKGAVDPEPLSASAPAE